jgi:type III secretion protein U
VWARRIVQFLRSILWIASVGALAYSMLRSHLRDLAGAEGQLVHVQAIGAYMTRGLAQQAAGVGFALAILDIVVTRVLWRSGLMMDRAEVERERRETEGDAQIKQERLRVDMGIALAALREAVGSASVVVTEGADRAAALRYDEHTNRERRPPILVASGRALVAHQIVDFAREFNISIVHAPKLARALCAAPPQSVVPESLYQDVALALRDAWAEHAPSRSEDA